MKMTRGKGDRNVKSATLVGIAMRAAGRSLQAEALLRQLIFPIGSGIIAQVGQRRPISKERHRA
jgi:hypothetical protein